MNPAMLYRQEANRLMDESRAFLNEMSWGEWRDFIASVQSEDRGVAYSNARLNLYYKSEELLKQMG